MEKRMFFFSCFPSCLPKKNAQRTRLSCGCVTGAVPASKQAANTHKEINPSKLWRALLVIAAISSILHRPSLDLQNGTRSTVRCPPHSFVSPNNHNDTARRCVQVMTNAFAAGTIGGGSNFYFQEFAQLGNRIPANLRVCVSSRNVLKSIWWRIRDCCGHYAPCNLAEVYFNFPTNLLSACARHLVPPACRLFSASSRPTQSPAGFFLNIFAWFFKQSNADKWSV